MENYTSHSRVNRYHGSAQTTQTVYRRKRRGLFASRYGNTYSYQSASRSRKKHKNTGKRLGALGKTAAIVFALFLALYVVFSAVGARNLKRCEVYTEIGKYRTELSAYNPAGTNTSEYTVVVFEESPTDASGTDLSATDSMCGVIVSSTDIYAHEASGGIARNNLAFRAGFNRLYSSIHDVELYAHAQAGAESISPSVFAQYPGEEISFVTPPTRRMLDTEGCYILQIERGGDVSNVVLIVSDTASPEVSYTDRDMWLGDDIKASDFVVSVSDVSPVVVEYVGEAPDVSKRGTQSVTVKTTDVCGNESSEKTLRLTINQDTEPPVITGAGTKSVIIGETVSYKSAVTLSDNRDKPEDISLTVDSSAVIPNQKGTYIVKYTATDRAGNSSNYEIKYTFQTDTEKEKDEQLAVYVEKVAKSIFKEGMTDTQKLRAIYNWCHHKLRYTGKSIKDNWRDGALRGFKTLHGDCFTYFSCSKALLNYCGFDNIDVEKNRKPNQSRHYWSMVNVGTGWYHYDTCIRHNTFNGFMRTDAQIEAYSKRNDGSHRIDKTKYPATPTTAYK